MVISQYFQPVLIKIPLHVPETRIIDDTLTDA
jgi:hypothetical protein